MIKLLLVAGASIFTTGGTLVGVNELDIVNVPIVESAKESISNLRRCENGERRAKMAEVLGITLEELDAEMESHRQNGGILGGDRELMYSQHEEFLQERADALGITLEELKENLDEVMEEFRADCPRGGNRRSKTRSKR